MIRPAAGSQAPPPCAQQTVGPDALADSRRSACSLCHNPAGSELGRRAQSPALPAELWHLIFSRLPLSTHSQCALVCRHWYNNLPDIRHRLARCLAGCTPCERLKLRLLPQGYSDRIRPWLAGHRSPRLPLLDRQHQYWQWLQDRLQQPPAQSGALQLLHTQVQAAAVVLSVLAYDSMCQQMLAVESPCLTLEPAAMDWYPAESVVSYRFSPCSRWLALGVVVNNFYPLWLRLYGWQAGRWQLQRLAGSGDRPVAAFKFCNNCPDVLVSVHEPDVLCWRPIADTALWQPTRLCRIRKGFSLCFFELGHADDLVFLSRDSCPRPAAQLVHLAADGTRGAWGQPTSHFYTRVPAYMIWLASLSWLVQIVETQDTGGKNSNEIHIWRCLPGCGRRAQWRCQINTRPPGKAAVVQVNPSQDGAFMTGLLTDGSVCLWAMDAQCRLEEKLTTRCAILPGQRQALSRLSGFCPDGRQLALAVSSLRIELWNLGTDGHWHVGDRLDSRPDADAPPDERLDSIAWSGNGQALIRRTTRRLDIWSRTPDGHWQERLVHRVMAGDGLPVYREGVGGTFYTLAASPEQRLWISGQDRSGQFMKKADLVTELEPLAASPDGLSLLTHVRGRPHLLQLRPRATAAASGPVRKP